MQLMRIRKIQEIKVKGVGDRIKQARLSLPRNGKSLNDLCEEVGISRTYWYDIENDQLKGALSIENLRKIEKALDIDLGVSFDEEEF